MFDEEEYRYLTEQINEFIEDNEPAPEEMIAFFHMMAMKTAINSRCSFEDYENCVRYALTKYKTLQQIKLLVETLK